MRITGFRLETQPIPICRLSMGLCRKATSRCPSNWGRTLEQSVKHDFRHLYGIAGQGQTYLLKRPPVAIPRRSPDRAAPRPPPRPLIKEGATRRELSLDLQVLHLLRDIDEQRSKALGDIVKTDATWNMLAELLRSRITRRRISVTSLCLASRGPVTSALRRLDQLLADGLVTYTLDPQDRRRKYIELTAEGANRMQSAVRGVAQRWAVGDPSRNR